MAKKKLPEAPIPQTHLLVSREEAASRIDERMARGRAMVEREVRNEIDYETLKNDHSKWSAYNKEMLKQMFTTPELAEEYSHFYGAVVSMRPRSISEKLDDLRRKSIGDGVHRLESIKERLDLIPLAIRVQGGGAGPAAIAAGNRVFLVHGHDELVREATARYLEKLGVDAIILHEQASGGRTLIEKLERYSDVSFAVVLLTPDDIGAAADEDQQLPRARQNVILELGYFVGRLGRDRVCALHRGEVELPGDYLGVVYVPFDDGGGWRLPLARELKAAGFEIDLNDAL